MEVRIRLKALLLIVVAMGPHSWARLSGEQSQEPDMKQKFAQAQKANTAALHQYTWQSRTEVKLKGETKKVKVEQVVFDASGQQQKTLLEESPKGGAPPSGGRLKQKIIAKKKKEFGELAQNLGSSSPPTPISPPSRCRPS